MSKITYDDLPTGRFPVTCISIGQLALICSRWCVGAIFWCSSGCGVVRGWWRGGFWLGGAVEGAARDEWSRVRCGAKTEKKRPSSSIASLREPSTTKLPPAKNHRRERNEENIRFWVRLFQTGFFNPTKQIKLLF